VKIQELGKLVADLGLLTRSQPQEKSERRQPTVGWGRGMNVELDSGSDGRLPGIQEDRPWGRKTLEYVDFFTLDRERGLTKSSNGEILEMAENTESPDLGPPPVAHFQDEDPIKFDAQPTTAASEPESENHGEDLPAALSVNLETRKRRRDSQGKLNIRRMSVFHSPPERIEDESATGGKAISGTLPIRAGAKRKMSAREDEGKGENKASEEFTFSRKSNVAFEDPLKMDKEKVVREESKARSRRESVSIQAPERRALGNKPVNTDPIISPKKSTVKGKISDEKPHPKKPSEPISKGPPRPRSRQSIKPAAETPFTISIPPTQESAPEVAEIQPPSLPPKTPAAPADLFSPTTTEPSTSRPPPGRDTPPPGELGPNGDANAGRAGRRARASVNYTEPSLNSKMRRPTKELVDAVDSRGRPVAGITVPSAAAREKCLLASVIKTEQLESEAWKRLPAAQGVEPTSPLSKKSTGTAPLKAISGNGKELRNEDIPVQSAAAAAISTLIQSNKERRKSQLGLATETKKEEKSGRDSLGVFDFVSSSPPRDNPTTKTTEGQARAMNSRRYSSIPGTSALALKDRSGHGEARPESRTSLKRQSSASAAAAMKDVSEAVISAGEDECTGLARSQRASRRSSMLV
jgi:hypothetical protein